MIKKKSINKFGVVFGLFLMYIGIYVFLVNTTNNQAVKNFTYINKVLAKLNFFQDKNGNQTPYSNTSNDLYNGQWASSKYPIQGLYNTGLIQKTGNSITINGVNSQINNTIIPPPRPIRRVRHSH